MHDSRSMSKLTTLLIGLVLSGCITINLPPGPGPLEEERVSGTGSAKVLLLDLSGVISSQDSDGLYERPSLVARVKEELTVAAKDTNIKALVLRINSPGGTVAASDMLHHELRVFHEKRKIPIVASIMDVGASGGYYVAVAADKIVAHPSSVTGSLGVIMLTVNARGLLEKIGIETNAITSGPRKDMGSPFRAMTDDERVIFQGVIDFFYNRFLTVIKEGRRNLSPEEIRKLADGRIYSGEQAKEVGLVDSVGYLEDAVDLAKNKAGLSEAKIIMYRKPGEYKQNIYSRFLGGGMMSGLPQFDLLSMVRASSPQFMYLWMP
jgi:protease IV